MSISKRQGFFHTQYIIISTEGFNIDLKSHRAMVARLLTDTEYLTGKALVPQLP